MSKEQEEASMVGLEFLHRIKTEQGKATNYSSYKVISCGHICSYQNSHVRRGNVSCKQCKSDEYFEKFTNAGLTLLDSVTSWSTRTKYSFRIDSCGHNVSAFLNNISGDSHYCPQCYEDKIASEAAETGLYEYIGKYQGCGVKRKYRMLSCGHIKKSAPKHIKARNLQCVECLEIQYKGEASRFGLILLGSADKVSTGYRKYRLPCGCSKDLRVFHVSENRWACDNCDDTYYMKPSTIYLVRIVSSNFTWLKLGVARNISNRIRDYKVKDLFSINEVMSVHFNVAKDAFIKERSIHAKYKDKRYSSEDMKVFMENGHSECYPIDMENELVDLLNNIRR